MELRNILIKRHAMLIIKCQNNQIDIHHAHNANYVNLMNTLKM